ncbi:DNA repair protein rhp57 [Batrachochytrium dendrobatidis]|nr:DNA repair protein rhp57 [Batrachochytrium dendrobatidis]KAK5666845.1 DNA repair protein rhp57 [Batrachochytrium dendrobatidis]
MGHWPRQPSQVGSILTQRRLSFGDQILDSAFGGGLLTGSINELFGPASAGKTQLALQLSLQVQMPFSMGGLDGGAMYISTDKNFPSVRLLELSSFSKAHPIVSNKGPDIALDRVFVLRVGDLETLHHLIIYQLEQHMIQNNVRLVVIDSIANSMRSDTESDPIDSCERNQCMAEALIVLKRLATQLQAVVLCINQVSWKPAIKHITSRSEVIKGPEHTMTSSNDIQELLGRACDLQPTMFNVISIYMNTSFFLDRDPPAYTPLNNISALRHMFVMYSPELLSGTVCKLRIHKCGVVGEK